jgi:phage gp46-like protein
MSYIHSVNNKIIRIKQAAILVSLFLFFVISGCSDQDVVVASVNDHELTMEQAERLMDALGYDINKKEDWKTFLESWTTNEAYRQELMEADEKRSEIVSLKGKNFEGELSRFYLEEREISKKLDTTITEKELKDHYAKNKDQFSLQDYLVKALYIKIPKGIEVESKLKESYLLKNDKDLTRVNSYAKLYAEDFYFDDAQWIYFNDLVKDIPLKEYNRDNLILNRTKTYFSDQEFTYFVNILDYRVKDEVPPFDFLKGQIREIILARRISVLREQIENEIKQRVNKKHDIQIHYNY